MTPQNTIALSILCGIVYLAIVCTLIGLLLNAEKELNAMEKYLIKREKK